jgi:hypothetical protein
VTTAVGWAECAKPNVVDLLGFTSFSPTYRRCQNILSVLAVFSVAGFDFACLAVFRGYHNAFQISAGVTIAF